MSDRLVKDKGKFSSIPILKYVLNNNINEVKSLIEKSSDLVDFLHKKSGDTPVLIAARYKRYDILKLLCENGADIEHKNIDGKRPLHEAAFSGCIECVSYILQKKANVDPLKRADWTPIMFAATHGHIDVFKKLLEFGANNKQMNKDGWTCFHLACREGHIHILEHLLEIDQLLWKTQSKNGRTPLHTAAMHGHKETVSFLLRNCAYIKDEKDSCGTTPLMDSLRFGFVEIANKLIDEHSSDLFQYDELGRCCIHIAAHSGQISSLKYLVESKGVDINLPCLNSSTKSIHFAAKEGHVKTFFYIISVGGLIDAVDKNNRTALHLSTAANKLNIVKSLLTDYRANSEIVDNCGKKANEYALTDDVKLCFR